MKVKYIVLILSCFALLSCNQSAMTEEIEPVSTLKTELLINEKDLRNAGLYTFTFKGKTYLLYLGTYRAAMVEVRS